MELLKEFLAPFTRIRIDENSGILLQDPHADPRRVRLVRAWNFIEPFVVFGLMMGVVWGSMLDMRLWWVRPSFAVLIVWTLVLSPIVHYPFEKDLFLRADQKRHAFLFYFFECRGLGCPVRYFCSMDGRPPHWRTYWKTILVVTLFVDLLFVCAFITFKEDIGERVIAMVGPNPVVNILFRVGFLVLLDAGLILLGYPWMLRLDNFRQSIRFIVAFLILIAVLTLGANLLFQVYETGLRHRFQNDPYMGLRGASAAARLETIDPIAVGGQWSGYVFWGFLQQLLFASIFCVQFSRAFDIGRSRLHFFATCLCSAVFFGLIHLPNFWLSMVTWIGGFFGSMFFMQCRNLFAFGIVHGFGGTITNKLLPINFSVGPSQVPK